MRDELSEVRGRDVRVVQALLFASGAGGLVLEISWLRLFGHVFGITYSVAGMVLGAYLGGMGLGAFVFGRIQARRGSALRLVGRLELAAALCAAPLPAALSWLRSWLSWSWSTHPAVQICLIALLIGPAAFCAGGSLPAASAALGSPLATTRVYAANTLGGLLGASAAALLPGAIGVYETYAVALLLQLTAAAVAWFWSSRLGPQTAEGTVAEPHAPTLSAWASILAALSGVLLLAMEVVWARILSTKLHNSSLTFALVLGLVIASLYGGTLLAARFARYGARALCVVWIAGTLALWSSSWAFAAISGAKTGLGVRAPLAYFARASGSTLLVVAPTCLLLGASLPLLWSHVRVALSARVGRLLAINTASSVVGSVAAGAWLLPELGVTGAYRVLSCAAVLGLCGALRLAAVQRVRVAIIGAVAASAALALPLPAAQRLGSPDLKNAELVEVLRGLNGDLSVHRDQAGALLLRHNVAYGLGSSSGSWFHRRMGQLALLRHEHPEHVAFLGMGTGITASAIFDHPSIRNVSIHELMPEVVQLNRHFAEANAGVLQDPRVRVVVGDGRRTLAAPGEPLDVVVSDLFIPWHPGTSELYSVELFETVRERLAPFGLFALWIPAYQIGGPELESVMAAFRKVFPTSEAWLHSDSDRNAVIGLFGYQAASLPGAIAAQRLATLRTSTQFPKDPWPSASRLSQLRLGPLPPLAATPNSELRPIVELGATFSNLTHRELTGTSLRAFLARHFPVQN